MTDQPTADQPVDDPQWKKDFPYESAGEDEVTRREFTRFLAYAPIALAGSGGLMALAASLRPANVGPERLIMSIDDIPPGRSKLFRYPTDKDPAIIVRPNSTRSLLSARNARTSDVWCSGTSRPSSSNVLVMKGSSALRVKR